MPFYRVFYNVGGTTADMLVLADNHDTAKACVAWGVAEIGGTVTQARLDGGLLAAEDGIPIPRRPARRWYQVALTRGGNSNRHLVSVFADSPEDAELTAMAENLGWASEEAWLA